MARAAKYFAATLWASWIHIMRVPKETQQFVLVAIQDLRTWRQKARHFESTDSNGEEDIGNNGNITNQAKPERNTTSRPTEDIRGCQIGWLLAGLGGGDGVDMISGGDIGRPIGLLQNVRVGDQQSKNKEMDL
ncbi:hypothetical protein NEUTE1DRAFT_107646 [Neurospora tetrasperma FGSC 2508]|uniref:Uncharacterized protein n=1 Tax=Neurospora tetrasperma (strain FGSC 2508 / ATCC MYA-4615 / P0657) TaxID=510951 RepID=F8MBC9_NEUT8|nr:uncharacterized protein NEUTE1DRAFT_107646 [Neurospora tetrasperma FGSC 2508]EGO61094.1 hypothetical protein NEUTE1DRAFT_107646 [Neurospora tetrasperma FGSC 2508]